MASRRKATWTAAVAAVGTAAGVLGLAALFGRKSAPAGPVAVCNRVALIGDSYAVGLGPQLAKLIPDFKFEGHVGISTASWANCASCATWLPGYKPEIVLVSLGANDGTSPDANSYQEIVRALHGLGSRVVWIEPPAGLAGRGAVRDTIASLGVPTIPATKTPLGPDGVHPMSYAPWASEIAQALGRMPATSNA